jgi:hypothetical protein
MLGSTKPLLRIFFIVDRSVVDTPFSAYEIDFLLMFGRNAGFDKIESIADFPT